MPKTPTPELASLAAKTLKDPRASKVAKRLAGSVLSNAFDPVPEPTPEPEPVRQPRDRSGSDPDQSYKSRFRLEGV